MMYFFIIHMYGMWTHTHAPNCVLQIIPQKCLNVFSPDELSLLISGVPSIDVEDWSRNT